MVAIRSKDHSTRYRLTQEELLVLIDKEARHRLKMSGEEFMRGLKDGTLPETVAKRDLEMIVRLLGPRWRTARSSSRTLTP